MIAVKAVMYHYVRPPDASLPHLRHLHIDDFRRQLDFFANEYGFLAKEEFIASVKSGVSPRPGVVLTFDDGLKDHYRYVLPELEQRDLWGISYIPTSPYLTHELLDVHRIHMLLAKHGGKEIFQSIHTMLSEDMLSHRHIAEFRTETYKTQNNDEYTNHVKRTLNYYINYNHRKGVIDELMAIYYPDETILVQEFYMTRDEICRMHNAGMIIGSHTVNHPVMSKLSVDEQRKEIELSFRFIEKIIGKIGL
jgi:peptidoglycan/xylan/chitin deacetylase (PgdA/CDA1 family)